MSSLSLRTRRRILAAIALTLTFGGIIAAVQVLWIGSEGNPQYPIVAWSAMRTSSPLDASLVAMTGLLLFLRVPLARMAASVFLYIISFLNLLWVVVACLSGRWPQAGLAAVALVASSGALAFLANPETKALFARGKSPNP